MFISATFWSGNSFCDEEWAPHATRLLNPETRAPTFSVKQPDSPAYKMSPSYQREMNKGEEQKERRVYTQETNISINLKITKLILKSGLKHQL